MYDVQRKISFEKLRGRVGTTIKVLCDGIDEENGCFAGRAYFQAPDIDGKVLFRAPFAEQGKYYDVLVTDNDSYNLYGRTEDYSDE